MNRRLFRAVVVDHCSCLRLKLRLTSFWGLAMDLGFSSGLAFGIGCDVAAYAGRSGCLVLSCFVLFSKRTERYCRLKPDQHNQLHCIFCIFYSIFFVVQFSPFLFFLLFSNILRIEIELTWDLLTLKSVAAKTTSDPPRLTRPLELLSSMTDCMNSENPRCISVLFVFSSQSGS